MRCQVGDITPAKLTDPNRVGWIGCIMQGTASQSRCWESLAAREKVEVPQRREVVSKHEGVGRVLGECLR
jgi:hypothetical protein